MTGGLFDADTPLLALRAQILDRVTEVAERGVYILGPEVKAFEQEFAEYVGVKHAIGVGDGADAITIGLRALGVGPTNEQLSRAHVAHLARETIHELVGPSDRAFEQLSDQLLELPAVDVSLLVGLPELIGPHLERLPRRDRTRRSGHPSRSASRAQSARRGVTQAPMSGTPRWFHAQL